jgi:hypothetical protein
VVKAAVAAMPHERNCACASAAKYAVLTQPDAIPAAAKERLKLLFGKYLGVAESLNVDQSESGEQLEICTSESLTVTEPIEFRREEQMAITVVGSVAFDTIETPAGKRERCLGGAATYFSLAASYFTDVRVIAVVGEDFGRGRKRSSGAQHRHARH